MNNHVMLIGRINNDIEKIEMDDKTTYKLMLNISRNFKNQDASNIKLPDKNLVLSSLEGTTAPPFEIS